LVDVYIPLKAGGASLLLVPLVGARRGWRALMVLLRRDSRPESDQPDPCRRRLRKRDKERKTANWTIEMPTPVPPPPSIKGIKNI
jgi:hypothetical protein